jgi:hypothetical protein
MPKERNFTRMVMAFSSQFYLNQIAIETYRATANYGMAAQQSGLSVPEVEALVAESDGPDEWTTAHENEIRRLETDDEVVHLWRSTFTHFDNPAGACPNSTGQMKMAVSRAAFVPVAIATKIVAIEPRARCWAGHRNCCFDPTLNDYGQPRGLAPTLEPSGHRGRSARLHQGPKKPIASPEISAALAL